MADLSVEVNINATKKSADTFADNIANGLQKSLGKLGMGGAVSVSKGGAVGAGIKEGMVAGLAAGGIVGVLGLIAEAVKDLPLVVAIMKIFKLILMLLFLPLIPILKPVLMGLAEFTKKFADFMKKTTEEVQKGMDLAPQINKTGNAFIDLEIGIANSALKLGGAIGQSMFNLGKGAFDLGGKIGQWLYDKVILPVANFISSAILKAFDWVSGIGEKIWDILKSPFQFVADKIKGLFEVAPKIAADVITSSPGATGLLKIIGKLFGGKQLGGPISEEGIYYLHKGERVSSATERGGSSNVSNISFAINNPQIRSDQDIKELVRQIEDRLKSDMRRRVSYGPRNF